MVLVLVPHVGASVAESSPEAGSALEPDPVRTSSKNEPAKDRPIELAFSLVRSSASPMMNRNDTAEIIIGLTNDPPFWPAAPGKVQSPEHFGPYTRVTARNMLRVAALPPRATP